MEYIDNMVKQSIIDEEKILTSKYPNEAKYGSHCTLWRCGLTDGLLNKKLYDSAKHYYNVLWKYIEN